MIESCFYFLWGSSIYLFGRILAQVLVWTLLLPACWRRGNSEGYSQGKAADWPWCQVSLGAQQHWAPCMLLWIVPILVSLSSVSGLCQLGSVWDDLPSSEYEQTPKAWEMRWTEKHHNNVCQDLDGKWKALSGADKARRGEILGKEELNELEIGCVT